MQNEQLLKQMACFSLHCLEQFSSSMSLQLAVWWLGRSQIFFTYQSEKVSVSAMQTWFSNLNHFLCVCNILSVMTRVLPQFGKEYCYLIVCNKRFVSRLPHFPLDMHYDFMTLWNDPSLRLCLTSFAVYKGCVVPLKFCWTA